MKLNPTAVALWLMLAGIGFLVADVRGAVTGAVVGLGLSLASSLFGR